MWQTLIIRLQDFMFEERKSEDQSVFPVNPDYIPEFSVVEVMVGAGHSSSAEEGFGLNMSRIRPTPLSVYSFLYPLGLPLLPRSLEQGLRFMEESADRIKSIRSMVCV